jgi:hypothetical protein
VCDPVTVDHERLAAERDRRSSHDLADRRHSVPTDPLPSRHDTHVMSGEVLAYGREVVASLHAGPGYGLRGAYGS